MPHDCDKRVIDVIVCLQIVHATHGSPRTGREQAPFRSFGETLSLRIEEFVNAIEERGLVVVDQVLVVNRTETVTPIKEIAQRPPIAKFARILVRVFRLRVVEAVLEERRRWLLCFVRHENEEMHLHFSEIILKPNLHVLARRVALPPMNSGSVLTTSKDC